MVDTKALTVGLDEDLRPLSHYLWQHGVAHRVSEQGGRQVIWVAGAADAERVKEVYRHWRDGSLVLSHTEPVSVARRIQPGAQHPVPLTLILLGLSLIGFLIASFDAQLHWLSMLTFFEFDRHGNAWIFSMPEHQYWRLLTPIFLHFGLLHIVFNGLWLWDLGGRVERVQGSWRLLGLVLLIGTGSNLAQALFSRAGIFGGMSGVIYGLLGYCWIWSRISGDHDLDVPNVILALMLGWMVLCMIGFAELLGVGAVANAAHLGGLLMGLLLGAAGAWLTGRRPQV